jgi:hypothetical protein
MIVALEEAASAGEHDPVYLPMPASQPTNNGVQRRGRPRKHIDPNFLEIAMPRRGPTDLATLLGCNPRTVRRWLLEYGLAEPGEPLFTLVEQQDGTNLIAHTPTPSKPTTLTDVELDHVMHQILETFPDFGQQMIAGHLEYQGHLVTRERIRQSYYRVHGPPNSFGRRRIQRRTYQVRGPLALWHHDGQHGKPFVNQQPITSPMPHQVSFASESCSIASLMGSPGSSLGFALTIITGLPLSCSCSKMQLRCMVVLVVSGETMG